MADKEYVITVRGIEPEEPKPRKRKTAAEKAADAKAKAAKEAAKAENDRIKAIKKGFAKGVGKVLMAKQVLDFAVNQVYVEQGNSDAAQKYGFWSSLAGQGMATAVAFALNPAMGALGVAAIGWSWAKRSISFDYNRYVEGLALGVARDRAGPSLNRSRE